MLAAVALVSAAPSPARCAPSASELLTEVQRRACLFFWQKADPSTGLTNDRASNLGPDDTYTVASTASTGYMLASLPIAVEHKWIPKQQAYDRAKTCLDFLYNKLPNVHGWYYHFIDKHTGERQWKCEVSTIDTTLLVEGALTCGQYFRGTDVQKLANAIYERLDWQWALTNDGARPQKRVVSMGWKPEDGFIASNWDSYCELMSLYILGMGAQSNPLPADCWDAWKRPVYTYGGLTTLAGGPIFLHQMAQGYYNFHHRKDRLGYDYWTTTVNATKINRQFCIDNMSKHKGYSPSVWGLNACDGPDGYNAFGVPEPQDGTVCPTGAIASLPFTPDLSTAAAVAMREQYGDKIWGRYGFSDSFNVDRSWYDQDVIGIDLGMAMIAIENARTGLVWKLMASHPSTRRGMEAAGFASF
jgi:hypothetical protein